MVKMKISKIQIKNFKSLQDVALNDLGNMVVLIGKNSSGKSNMLEALYKFFNDFNLIEPSPVGPVTGFDNHLWYDIKTKNPIEITLWVKFDAKECEEIFPTEALNMVRKRFPESYNQVSFCRRVVNVKTGWKTEYVKWADIPLVRDNKLVSPEELCKSLTVPPPRETTTPRFPESAAAKIIGKVAPSLQERVKGKFRLAKVTRDSVERPSDLVMRAPIVDSETYEMLRFLKQSRTHEDIKRWIDVEKMFENASSMRLDIREGEIFARKRELCLPIHLIGGGDQEALILKRFLMREDSITAIEEPEMHLHPRLIMRVLELIKAISARSQVFLATHSPIIIDRVDIQNVWIAKMETEETRFIGFGDAEEMRNMLMELDTPLSNILFAEKVLLVEGLLEKVMLPIFAKNMGIDPDGFSIIPVKPKLKGQNGFFTLFRREPSVEYRLRIWSEISRKIGIPLFLLLHKAAKFEVEALIREGSLPRRNCAILSTGIENYIPVETLVSVLNENYRIRLTTKDIDAKRPRMVEIKRILTERKKLHPGWKTFIAEKVAEKMPREKIPDEIKMLFESMLIVSLGPQP